MKLAYYASFEKTDFGTVNVRFPDLSNTDAETSASTMEEARQKASATLLKGLCYYARKDEPYPPAVVTGDPGDLYRVSVMNQAKLLLHRETKGKRWMTPTDLGQFMDATKVSSRNIGDRLLDFNQKTTFDTLEQALAKFDVYISLEED
jgi:hypothetical protein